MSTREEFEKWCDLTERDPTDRDLYAAWEESRAAALEEAAIACERTRAKDAFHYELGTACASSVRALAKDGGE